MSTSTTARLLADAIQLLKDMGDSVRYPKVLYGHDMRLEKLLLEYEIHTHVPTPPPKINDFPSFDERCHLLIEHLATMDPPTVKELSYDEKVAKWYRINDVTVIGTHINADLKTLVLRGRLYRYKEIGISGGVPYRYTVDRTIARANGAFTSRGEAWGNRQPRPEEDT